MTQSESRISRRLLLWAGIFLAVAGAGATALLGIGRWLVVQDPLAHADVIVVLSGRLPERAMEAAQIYRAGYAGQVWISAPASPEEELKAMKISYVGEDFYNEMVLIAQGVPADSIHILERPNLNTEDEIRQISESMRSRNYRTAIVVTSKPHTRRVRTIWRKLAGPNLSMLVRYASGDPYDGAHWWRHTRDSLDVVRESLGLCNAWAGFPLRPSR